MGKKLSILLQNYYYIHSSAFITQHTVEKQHSTLTAILEASYKLATLPLLFYHMVLIHVFQRIWDLCWIDSVHLAL